MTPAEALNSMRRALSASYRTFAHICGVDVATIKAACRGQYVTAANWTQIEEKLGGYLTPERVRYAGITQDAVDVLFEILPFGWKESADAEARVLREFA